MSGIAGGTEQGLCLCVFCVPIVCVSIDLLYRSCEPARVCVVVSVFVCHSSAADKWRGALNTLFLH